MVKYKNPIELFNRIFYVFIYIKNKCQKTDFGIENNKILC